MLSVVKKIQIVEIITSKGKWDPENISQWRKELLQNNPNVKNIPLIFATKDKLYVWLKDLYETAFPTYIFETEDILKLSVSGTIRNEINLTNLITNTYDFEILIRNCVNALINHPNDFIFLPKDFLDLFAHCEIEN